MSEFNEATRTRPPDGGDTQLITILRDAVVHVLDALASMHHHKPGSWLDEIEHFLIREAEGSATSSEGVRTLQTLVQRVRNRLEDEAFEV